MGKKRYHLSGDGIFRVCEVKPGTVSSRCPGGAHFDSLEEGYKVFAKMGTDTHITKALAGVTAEAAVGIVGVDDDSVSSLDSLDGSGVKRSSVKVMLERAKALPFYGSQDALVFEKTGDGRVVLPEWVKNELDLLITEGLVSVSKSEDGRLTMFKYSKVAPYNGPEVWTNPVLCNMRGVLVDSDGTVVGRGFTKFFNLGEHANSDFLFPLPSLDSLVEVTKKMDGSLGLIVNLDGKATVFTQGSAQKNEIALKGQEILDKTHPGFCPRPGETVLAEIISPINRIVVDYGQDQRLVGLGVVDNASGLDSKEFKQAGWDGEIVSPPTGVSKTKMSLGDAIALPVPEDEEGYVVKFADNRRIKIKGDNYVNIHRLKYALSAKTLFRQYREGKIDELVKDIEDRGPGLASIAKDLRRAKTVVDLQVKERSDYIALNADKIATSLGISLPLKPADKPAFFTSLQSQSSRFSREVFSQISTYSLGNIDALRDSIINALTPKGAKSFMELISKEYIESATDDETGRERL